MASQTAQSARKKNTTMLRKPNRTNSVACFEVHYYQTLNSNGELVAPLPKFAENPQPLIALYRLMVKTRLFDKKAISLQRRGQLGTYASSMGQEAIGAAVGSAMDEQDVLLPTYREYAAQFYRGVTMTEILLYWGGSELGMAFKGPVRDFPICVPIAGQIPHAVGVAYAMKLRNEKRVAVCVFGDGATSKGDFYESINAAAVWNLPVVFVINNNQWAISMPRDSQTRAETLAQKGIAAGIDGEQVDGNDVIAVRHRLDLALSKARQGNGPTIIEALTYRLCDHTTADDASRYRSEKELQEHWQYEPLIRLRQYLTDLDYWSEAKEQQLRSTVGEEIEDAVADYLATPPQSTQSMFDYLYQSVPNALMKQRQATIEEKQNND